MAKVGGSSGGVTGAALVPQDLHLPPLRSLDDFAMGSARFQLPNIGDLEKWGNRVVKNLLYYQTNYFILLIIVYGIMTVLHPLKIISGLLVQAMLIAIFLHFFREKNGSTASFISSRLAKAQRAEVNQQEKWYFLAGALLLGFLLLYWFDAILLSSFTLLLPISMTFVHASLRLRNIRNKVANTMESFGPSTPMGVFLDAMNITADNILS